MLNDKQMAIDIRKPLGLGLNKEGASMLVRGLEKLPLDDQKNVVYQRLIHDLNMIVTIWDRRIKNEKIIQEQRRFIKAKQKSAKQITPPQTAAVKQATVAQASAPTKQA